MTVGTIARILAVIGCAVAALASASSQQGSPPPPQGYGQANPHAPPAPQQMDGSRALGLWRSSFGPVKIESDDSRGGVTAGAVHGVWSYQRAGQWVEGYFHGTLGGNVLQFRWQEPGQPPLMGEGYLVFDVSGQQYTGRWWNDRRDRGGPWNGWRNAGADSYAEPAPSEPTYLDPYANPPPSSTPPAPGPVEPGPAPGPSPGSPNTPQPPPNTPYY